MAAAISLSATTTLAAEVVGEVIAVTAEASVSGQSGDRTLVEGDEVFVGEQMTTDAKGTVQLRLTDDTLMAFQANAEVKIEKYLRGGDTTENEVVVVATAGRGRFRSGNSGPGAYTVKINSSEANLHGTAFDYTVMPDGKAKMLLLEGEVEFCGENGSCVTVATPCSLVQTNSGGGVEEIEPGKRRDTEISENFPFVMSDDSLVEELRIADHGCRPEGGTSRFALDGSGIKAPHLAVGVGVGGIILCVLLCPSSGPTTDTNNATN